MNVTKDHKRSGHVDERRERPKMFVDLIENDLHLEVGESIHVTVHFQTLDHTIQSSAKFGILKVKNVTVYLMFNYSNFKELDRPNLESHHR